MHCNLSPGKSPLTGSIRSSAGWLIFECLFANQDKRTNNPPSIIFIHVCHTSPMNSIFKVCLKVTPAGLRLEGFACSQN